MAKPTDLVQGTLDLQPVFLYAALHCLEQEARIKAEWRSTGIGRMATFIVNQEA